MKSQVKRGPGERRSNHYFLSFETLSNLHVTLNLNIFFLDNLRFFSECYPPDCTVNTTWFVQ